MVRDAIEAAAISWLAGGYTEAVAVERGLIARREPPPRPRLDTAAKRASYLAAGPRSLTDGEATDDLLRRVSSNHEEAVAYRAWLDVRTLTLVDKHGFFWPIVEALVPELLKNDVLSKHEVLSIIHPIVYPALIYPERYRKETTNATPDSP